MTQTNTLDAALALANTSSILAEVNEVLARLAAAVETLSLQMPVVYQEYTSQRLASAIENLTLQLPAVQGHQGSAETTVPSSVTAATMSDISALSHAAAPMATVSATCHEAPATTTATVSTPSPVTATGGILTPAEVEARLANFPESTSFYVVARGLEPGVYDTLAEASAYTTGVTNASMRKVNIKSVALAHYATLYDRGLLVRVTR